ncbi:uncharacterized protein LOC134711168 [Mytilus trossulus]|uniref:uncharacterized protein LOC134711168 n=1 Tax=Mytilus trossulus TaxID=6551 RepID=UPI0030050FF4
MQSIRTTFTIDSDGNSVVEEVRNILSKSELPEDWKSEPWTNFVTEMMTNEMITRQIKRNCVNVWQAYARKWRELEPDLNVSKVWPVFAGSYTEGMPNACDIDMIFVATWAEAYEYFGTLRDNVNSLPFISDLCHPGYIKIILPSNTRRYYDFLDYYIKKDGRYYYLSSTGFVRVMKECGTTGDENHINGPALTEEGIEGTSTDIVHAIKCANWPSFANDIFQRTHFNGDVEKIKHLSVYAVATGHALSKHKDIEWRLSFTEAEKVLVMNWTDTQYHCYYLLKHFKMIHLKNSDVLCSYFIKTVIFWVSDVIHNAKWQPIRLMELLFKSLTLLHIMYRNHYLPNYFIPQNNMIDHKSKDECLILADMISAILTSGRIKEIIAELLCENDIEDIFIYSMNWYTKNKRTTSCRILCKAIRQFKEISQGFTELLIVNESLFLSSLTIMMSIQSRSQCEALEEEVAILPQIVSLEFIGAFQPVIRRQIADYYHSLRTRYSRKKS